MQKQHVEHCTGTPHYMQVPKMGSTYLGWVKLIVLILVWNACWPIERCGENGELIVKWVCRDGMKGERKIMLHLYIFLGTELYINWGIAVYLFYLWKVFIDI
jgi:hypothetical protein